MYSGCQACGRTSRGHTGGRFAQERKALSSAVLASILFARRIQPFLSLVLCTNELIVLHLLGIILFYFILFL